MQGRTGTPHEPEHTKESYQAAARMGAGIVECDVTFTGDGTLVCRHAQNDLATTTNILLTPLASTCIKPFTPATFDAGGDTVTPASAECHTSELTVQEFKSLRQDGLVQPRRASTRRTRSRSPSRERHLKPLHM